MKMQGVQTQAVKPYIEFSTGNLRIVLHGECQIQFSSSNGSSKFHASISTLPPAKDNHIKTSKPPKGPLKKIQEAFCLSRKN